MRHSRLAIAALLMCAAITHAQTPLSDDDALRQLYSNYDAKTQTTRLDCATDKSSGSHGFCETVEQNTSLKITVILSARVQEKGISKIYFLTSANEENNDCHACAPQIGMAVFAWKNNRWQMEASDAAVGLYGAWGEPATPGIVLIGNEHYGITLGWVDGGQGYEEQGEYILAPIGNSVREVFSCSKGENDFGAYDPHDPMADHIKWRSSAAINFTSDFQGEGDDPLEYFDIEVISRGNDEDRGKVVPKNFTDRYRFLNGKYRLIKHTAFTEAAKPTSPATKKSK